MIFTWQAPLVCLAAFPLGVSALAQVKTEASASYEKTPGYDNKLVPTFVARDVRHEFLGPPGEEAKFIRIIHERSEKTSIEGGMGGPVNAELFEIPEPGRPARSRWKATASGNSVHVDVEAGYWTIKSEGCCGSTSSYDLRSLITGRNLFSYSYPRSSTPLIITSGVRRGVDLSDLRVMGFINSHWPVKHVPSVPPGVDEKKWLFVGELYYASGERLIDRIALLREQRPDPADDPDELSVSEIRGNDFKVIKRKVRLKFFEEVIEIPLENDRLQIEAATSPKVWRLMKL